MISKNYRFLLFSLILCFNAILPAVLSDTLIKATHGLIRAETVAVDDDIIAHRHNFLTTTKITHLSKTCSDKIVSISTDHGSFYAAPDQLFFDPAIKKWIAAQDITTQTTFLNAQLQHCRCRNVEIIVAPNTKIIHITTTAPHTFFVTEQELLTHNAFPLVIGLSWLFGGGLEFLGISIGTAP